MKIEKVLDWISDKKSKMILYTYDAFVFDVHPNEREEILSVVKSMMEEGGFPVKIEEGINYDSLVVID
jgi:DNA polymerase I-like protein with 3'-5' exonuclease and polymerase domains